MATFLEERIRVRQERLDQISKEIEELQRLRRDLIVEIRAYKDVIENIDTAFNDRIAEELNKVSEKPARISRMSLTWRNILARIADKTPIPVSVDEIKNIVKDLNVEMSDESLRSQLSVYTARGYLSRPAIGKYIITSHGANAVASRRIIVSGHISNDEDSNNDEDADVREDENEASDPKDMDWNE